MNTEAFSDARIVESWGINALPWTAAVREGQIESRKQVTDQAIIDAILNRYGGDRRNTSRRAGLAIKHPA
ncbi:MAG: hypothetical protein PHR16_04550 [Methylovulum sp.]|nr:hypothetical protein [Methylovulum sp.]